MRNLVRRLLLCGAALVVVGLGGAGVSAQEDGARPGVVIHAIGDSGTTGDASKGRYSYRRYLYHTLTARGYNVRFVGALSDCSVDGVDYDSHYDGVPGGKTSDIKMHLRESSGKVRRGITAAVSSLRSQGSNPVSLVRVVMTGGEDAQSGRNSKDISESDIKMFVGDVEAASNGIPDVDKMSTIVIPSVPPGGMRTKEDGVWRLERDFKKDSKYEDYRYFLTWRGYFFDKAKNAVDCMSYIDFLQHYDENGSNLNKYGDMAIARCVFDNIVARKAVGRPRAPTAKASCSGGTRDALTRDVTSNLPPYTEGTELPHVQPAIVNPRLPKLTSLIAKATLPTAPARHSTCSSSDDSGSGGGGDDVVQAVPSKSRKSRLRASDDDEGSAPEAAPVGFDTLSDGASAAAGATDGTCTETAHFPAYEPYAETDRDLWGGAADSA